MLQQFSHIFAFILLAIAFVAGGLLTNKILRRNRPTRLKLDTYECGEDPIESAWHRFNVRFYVIALVFIIFDVEIVFLFPWALVFKQLGWLALTEMFVFLGILVLGFAYIWSRGDLDWVRPEPVIPTLDNLMKLPGGASAAVARLREAGLTQRGIE